MAFTAQQDSVEPLYSIFGVDPKLGEIVGLFVAEMPNRIRTLVEQYNSEDWEGLQRTAHQLRGAAGSYGFDGISPAAARLEQFLDVAEPEQDIREAVEQLIDTCRRARAGGPG